MDISALQGMMNNISETGESLGGKIKVTIDGKIHITKIEIDNSLISELNLTNSSSNYITDLVINTFNTTIDKVNENLSQELLANFNDMSDLSSMFNDLKNKVEASQNNVTNTTSTSFDQNIEITVNNLYRIHKLSIKPEIINAESPESVNTQQLNYLQDILVNAIHNAIDKVKGSDIFSKLMPS